MTVVAGAHGLWLLPTLLSLIGGDNPPKSAKVEHHSGAKVVDVASNQVDVEMAEKGGGAKAVSPSPPKSGASPAEES